MVPGILSRFMPEFSFASLFKWKMGNRYFFLAVIARDWIFTGKASETHRKNKRVERKRKKNVPLLAFLNPLLIGELHHLLF